MSYLLNILAQGRYYKEKAANLAYGIRKCPYDSKKELDMRNTQISTQMSTQQ